MYFSLLPDIAYDEKPISYPFSKSDYVVAKNFFRRYKVNETAFSYAVLFTKYSIQDGETPDTIARKAYGNAFYDWVVLLTNNLVDARYDWPLTPRQLYDTLSQEFDDPYAEVHHYETADGTRVDETYYNGSHKINEGGTIVTKAGNTLSQPISVAEHYARENETKREIYLLKPRYFRQFVVDFKKKNKYKKDKNNYISQRLKRTG